MATALTFFFHFGSTGCNLARVDANQAVLSELSPELLAANANSQLGGHKSGNTTTGYVHNQPTVKTNATPVASVPTTAPPATAQRFGWFSDKPYKGTFAAAAWTAQWRKTDTANLVCAANIQLFACTAPNFTSTWRHIGVFDTGADWWTNTTDTQSGTFSPGAITLNNEYLYMLTWCRESTAQTNRQFTLIQEGSDLTTAQVSKLVTPTFTADLAETLTDNFNDASIDATKWTTFAAGVTETTTLNVAVQATAGVYSGITSVNKVDLRESYVYVRFASLVTNAAGAQQQISLQSDSRNSVYLTYEAGRLDFGKQVNNVFSAINTTTWANPWLRMRESAGTLYVDTSSDGVTWTNLWSVADPVLLNQVTVVLQAGTWQTVASPGTAQFDNLNYPAQTTTTALATTGISTASTGTYPAGLVSMGTFDIPSNWTAIRFTMTGGSSASGNDYLAFELRGYSGAGATGTDLGIMPASTLVPGRGPAGASTFASWPTFPTIPTVDSSSNPTWSPNVATYVPGTSGNTVPSTAVSFRIYYAKWNAGLMTGTLKVEYDTPATANVIATINPSMPVLTGAVTTAELYQATVAGSMPVLVGSVLLAQATDIVASIAASLPVLTGALTAQELYQATLAAAMPVATGNITVIEAIAASIAGSMVLPTATLTSALTYLASLSEATPVLTGSIATQTQYLSTITGQFPVLVGLIDSRSILAATVGAILPALTGSVAAQEIYPTDTNFLLPTLTSQLSAQELYSAAVAGAFQLPAIQLTAAEFYSSHIAADLPLLQALVLAGGQLSFVASVAASLPTLSAAITGSLLYTGSVAAPVPLLTSQTIAQELYQASSDSTLFLPTAAIQTSVTYAVAIAGRMPVVVGDASALIRYLATLAGRFSLLTGQISIFVLLEQRPPLPQTTLSTGLRSPVVTTHSGEATIEDNNLLFPPTVSSVILKPGVR